MKLSGAITRYVEMKRILGVSFRFGAGVLRAFSRQIGDVSVGSVAKWQVLSFLDSQKTSNVTWLVKYRILKAFFEYWMARNEVSDSPMPRSRVVTSTRRFAPCIYSVSELRKLLRCTYLRRKASCREFDSDTLRTVLLFLYGTGARPNEALAMTQANVDLTAGTVTLHRPNTDITRTVPIGPSLLDTLRVYFKFTFQGRCKTQNFFVRKDGRPISPQLLSRAFHILCRKAGISRRDGISSQPRMIDLRHTFAVHCLNAWLKEGRDLRSMLPILGAYLGHARLNSSEAYLSVTPGRFWKQLSRLTRRTLSASSL
jgi:integrase/recombinase XerD